MSEPLYRYPITIREVESLTTVCTLPPCFDEEAGPKAYQKWRQSIKKLIYGSVEYKTWVKCKKDNEGIPFCVVSNIPNLVELHHYPCFLIDYIDTCINYFDSNNMTITSLAIADCVLRLHYDDIVCYTFLTKSFHDKFHETGDIIIPDEAVRGDLYKLMTHPIMKYMSNYSKGKIGLYFPKFVEEYPELFEGVNLKLQEEL